METIGLAILVFGTAICFAGAVVTGIILAINSAMTKYPKLNHYDNVK